MSNKEIGRIVEGTKISERAHKVSVKKYGGMVIAVTSNYHELSDLEKQEKGNVRGSKKVE